MWILGLIEEYNYSFPLMQLHYLVIHICYSNCFGHKLARTVWGTISVCYDDVSKLGNRENFTESAKCDRMRGLTETSCFYARELPPTYSNLLVLVPSATKVRLGGRCQSTVVTICEVLPTIPEFDKELYIDVQIMACLNLFRSAVVHGFMDPDSSEVRHEPRAIISV